MKKNVRTINVSALLVAALATGAMAQALPQMPRRPASTPEQKRLLAKQRQQAMDGYRDQLEAMRKKRFAEAGVSAAQQEKMAQIGRKYDPQMRKLQEQMLNLMRRSQQEQMAVLTPSQRKKLMQRRTPIMPR